MKILIFIFSMWSVSVNAGPVLDRLLPYQDAADSIGHLCDEVSSLECERLIDAFSSVGNQVGEPVDIEELLQLLSTSGQVSAAVLSQLPAPLRGMLPRSLLDRRCYFDDATALDVSFSGGVGDSDSFIQQRVLRVECTEASAFTVYFERASSGQKVDGLNVLLSDAGVEPEAAEVSFLSSGQALSSSTFYGRVVDVPVSVLLHAVNDQSAPPEVSGTLEGVPSDLRLVLDVLD